MVKMIEAYDSYGDFDRNLYFALVFNMPPSSLELRIPMKDNKEMMETTLSILNFEHLDMETVFKNWNTKDFKNSMITDDFIFEYLFKSTSRNVVIWISLDENELYIDFLYDGEDKELENWIVETNHQFRYRFGEMKTPTFKILSKNDRGFYTKDINTKDTALLDIEALYNDDFKEVDEIINNSMNENRSGLILLHGIPGAGKTTYIKNLISKFNKKNFIFIQNDFVHELLQPQFISFLIKHKDSVLVIEDAEKVVMSRDIQEENSVVSTILQLTDGLFSDYLNIKVICTFNSDMNNIDSALFRKGRMIANYEFKALSKDKTNALLTTLGHENQEEELTLADIFMLKEKSFEKQENHKIGFNT